MCSVCDDKLLDTVCKELSHHGLFVSVSVIEDKAIKIYDLIGKLYPGVKLSSSNKDDKYYNILSDLICSEILAETRLAKSRNTYEATALLTLLQSYLDRFTTEAKISRVRAPEVFIDVLDKLPFRMTFQTKGDGWSSIIENQVRALGQTVMTKKCRLCANVDHHETLCKCTEQGEEPGGCYESLTFAINYKSLCIGFKIDPSILNLGNKIYKDDLPDYIKIMENTIDKVATEMKTQAQEIFLMIYEEHKNDY